MICLYKNKNNIFKIIYVNEFNCFNYGIKFMVMDLFKRVFFNYFYRNDNINNKD